MGIEVFKPMYIILNKLKVLLYLKERVVCENRGELEWSRYSFKDVLPGRLHCLCLL